MQTTPAAGHSARLPARLAVLLAGGWLALTLTACGQPPGDGIATANGQATGNPDQTEISNDPEERMRKFTQCMRDNGIDMPDPVIVENGDGKFRVEMRRGEAAPGGKVQAPSAEEMEKFKQAHEACRQHMPEGGPMGKPDPEMQEQMRQFAKCMRDNGVEDFPDPQDGGGIAIGPGMGVDPNDPAFQAAHEKCDALMPGRKQTGAPAS